MPQLIHTSPEEQVRFGLWLIREPESFFRDRLELDAEEVSDLEALRGLRRLEWLASRLVLHRLTGRSERLSIAKTAALKPHFRGEPGLFCSLTHSHGAVGALLADRPCGCDVQVYTDKMERVAAKFVGAQEAEFVEHQPVVWRQDLLHILWSAKESLYKADGLKALEFRTQLRVMPFVWDGVRAQTTGLVVREGVATPYDLLVAKLLLPDGRPLMMACCLGAPTGA
jgi:4'-phosphopantetheinyl transferase